MEIFVQLLAALLWIAFVPLFGYAVLLLARRWPRATLALLLALLTVAFGALGYAEYDGFSVDRQTRKMEVGSAIGRWCFDIGYVIAILGLPALPLLAIARVRNGANMGPVGPQLLLVLYGYFMACTMCGMVLFSWLTGIVK